MYIVRVAGQFPPAPGGLAPGMLALSLAQHRRGHRMTVITRDTPSSMEVDENLPFDVIRIPAQSLTLFGWKAASLLRDLGDTPDIIHCHGPASAPVLLRKPQYGPPVFLTLHAVRRYQYGLFQNLNQVADSFEQVTGLPARNRPRPYHPWFPRIAWEFFIERYMCQQADHLALVAEYFGPQVGGYYGVSPDKCTVTYNGSDLIQSAIRDAGEVKASYGFDAGAKVVLYAGRLDWVKRAHLLVQAMLAVLEVEPCARLLLAGDGDQVADLKVLVARMGLEEYVTFAGWVPHQWLLDIYGFVDCLCLPSIWEGLSKVLLEAMSMEVPVLGSDIPANRELFRDEEYGWLVREPTLESWAAAVCEVLGNPDMANARARRAAKLVEQEYRWQHVAERLDKAYELALVKD